MTNSKETRALNAFAAMGSLSDDYILSAEQMLYEAEAGIYRPEKPMGGFRRFLNSGWGAAVIAGIVALAVLIFIIQAGVNPPVIYEPPVKPAGSTIEMSTEGVNYTISTEQEHYLEGTGCITVVMTGKAKGKIISTPGGWHLERLTPEGAKAEEISYTEEMTFSAKPDKDAYATLSKILYGTYTGGGFPAGTYRLHATKYDGEKYVSVAWCEFTVGEGEADTSAPTNSSKLPFTIMLDQSIYTTRDTALSIRFRANEPGVPLSRGNCWSIYRMENGERIHLGSQTAEYAFEGEEVAPNEYAEEQYALSIRTATGGNCDTLPVGEYELVFDGDGSSFSFEVLELPEDTVTRFAYYLSSGLLILEGTNNAADPFSAEGYPVDYEGLTDGDRVEIRMADFILETWPCQIKVYAVRKVTDGTIDNIPADLLAQLKSACAIKGVCSVGRRRVIYRFSTYLKPPRIG